MPMSSSALVDRSEMLDLVGALEAALPTAFADQDRVVAERERLLAEARTEADKIRADARVERDRLVGESDVFQAARHAADEERETARHEAEELRRETDEYVDTRLATFEITLTKTLDAVSRGRNRLQDRSHFDALGDTAEPDGIGLGGTEQPLSTADGTGAGVPPQAEAGTRPV